MSGEILSYFESSLDMTLSSSPTDYYSTYVYDYTTRDSGSIMPPSPLVTRYGIAYEFYGMEKLLRYKLSVEWVPWLDTLISQIPKWQIYHRSRLPAVAVSELRKAELDRRVNKPKQWMHQLNSAALSETESKRLNEEICAILMDSLTVDPDWILEYQKSHKGRSLGGGWRWENTSSLTMSDWANLKSKTRENMERLMDNGGKYTNIRYNQGIRARAEPFETVSDAYDVTVERSRIVMFHPLLSTWTVFMNKNRKIDAYTKIMNYAMDYLNVEGERYFPYLEGGKVYLRVADWFNEGYKFRALDGSAWESNVGILLGKYFNPYMTYTDGISQLPSGITPTSIYGTLAMMAATRHAKGKMIQLGDDLNTWSLKDFKSQPFIQDSYEDTRAHWILGLQFLTDPDVPRLSGFKISMDRVGELHPLRMEPYESYGGYNKIKGSVDPNSEEYHNMIFEFRRRDNRVRSLYAQMISTGEFGEGKTILEAISESDTQHTDYFSGGEMLEHMIMDTAIKDPLIWAEENHVKELTVSG